MTRTPHLIAATALSFALAGCGASAIPQPRPNPAVAPPPTIVRPVQHNALIGSSADAIGRQFGKPRLDVTEGTARKLQFAGSSCILDVYLYPNRAGAEPVATHVDARLPDGRGTDVNGCAQSLRR